VGRVLRRSFVFIGLGFGVALYALFGGFIFRTTEAEMLMNNNQPQPQEGAVKLAKPSADGAVSTHRFPRQEAVSLKPMLRWDKVAGAVSYEIELFAAIPGAAGAPRSDLVPFFSAKRVYVNGFNADLPADFAGVCFFWRVRGLDISGIPLGAFSDRRMVQVDRKKNPVQKPIPTSFFNLTAGSTLLYPVYAWIPIAGAEKYEVEILDNMPENPNGVAPSIHRIDSAIAVGFDYYDEKPRQSSRPFWWRVRGLDSNGNPVGVYSDAGKFRVNPKLYFAVATFGDSITHGGGDVSYSPADWEYSYQSYLEFPTINLARSSDTSETMVERFERDVLPFQPRHLLIMGGTNSLRAGVEAESVIEDFKSLKAKCLANKIKPVFLTLPPINPKNISNVFGEATDPGWQRQFQLVNDYIRTQEHIDVAIGMAADDGTLPDQLGIDGLHLGIIGKQKIAAAVNENWRHIVK
jgi:lysophospholipase L1-like esterase